MSSQLSKRRIRVDFGPHHPVACYLAPPDVIARFLAALKEWNPDCTAEVEPIDDPDGHVPPLPYWRLWVWE